MLDVAITGTNIVKKSNVQFEMASLFILRSVIFTCTSFYFTKLFCASQEVNGSDIKPLLLTPLIKAGYIKEAQKAALVTGIPELESYKSYSGYLTVNEESNSRLFFWFFCSLSDCDNDPVVLWLQGGPGRSSLHGLFLENGPLDMRDGTLRKRQASFTDHHSVIYLDNPVGAGFSRTDSIFWHDKASDVAKELYVAIPQFFTLFPDLQKNKFFIASQSYAQKYVVRLVDLILKMRTSEKHNFNLVGVALGNGLSDAYAQTLYSGILYQTGLINNKQYKKLKELENTFARSEGGNIGQTSVAFDKIFNFYKDTVGGETFDRFIATHKDHFEEPHLMQMLNDPKWKKAIHAEDILYSPWSARVNNFLYLDTFINETPYMVQMINNYKALFYFGQLEITAPYRTNVKYLKKLNFTGANAYDNVERQIWLVDGEVAGYVTQVGNVTEMLVRNSGHSVAHDQIVWAAEMLYRFTRDIQPFTAPIPKTDDE